MRRGRELVEQPPALASAPLVATDEDAAQDLAVLEESLGDANAAAR